MKFTRITTTFKSGEVKIDDLYKYNHEELVVKVGEEEASVLCLTNKMNHFFRDNNRRLSNNRYSDLGIDLMWKGVNRSIDRSLIHRIYTLKEAIEYFGIKDFKIEVLDTCDLIPLEEESFQKLDTSLDVEWEGSKMILKESNNGIHYSIYQYYWKELQEDIILSIPYTNGWCTPRHKIERTWVDTNYEQKFTYNPSVKQYLVREITRSIHDVDYIGNRNSNPRDFLYKLLEHEFKDLKEKLDG